MNLSSDFQLKNIPTLHTSGIDSDSHLVKKTLDRVTVIKGGLSACSLKDNLLPNGLEPDAHHNSETWYTAWLETELLRLPIGTFDIFHAAHGCCTAESHGTLFTRTFLSIAAAATQNSPITIDQIIGVLIDDELLSPETVEQNLNYVRYFVFTVLGYQTTLFSAVPLAPNSEPPRHLRIAEDFGCCNYTHATLVEDVQACAREPLNELLMGFGVLLPSRNLCVAEDQGIRSAFEQQVEIAAQTFNAHALQSIAGIKIKWTTSLSCHLEYNSTTREISVYCFASFCQFCLARYQGGKGRGVLHACATTSRYMCQWATEADTNQFLLEILLSYRLLFGQNKQSRRLFRSIEPTLGPDGSRGRDLLLSQLCGTRLFDSNLLDLGEEETPVVDKKTYCLPMDFPILRYRLVVLSRCLAATEPRGWRQLWRDNRNSANWLTFWAVIAFGAFGSLMALLQVILQAVQLCI